jgi:hypothetical protein
MCARVEEMPTRWHESSDGRYRVSTPELTVLDLIQRERAVGGMDRVREVLRALWPHCSGDGLLQALNAVQSVPAAQRLGALLSLDGGSELMEPLADWLRGKQMRPVALEGLRPRGKSCVRDSRTQFKVWVPPRRRANA